VSGLTARSQVSVKHSLIISKRHELTQSQVAQDGAEGSSSLAQASSAGQYLNAGPDRLTKPELRSIKQVIFFNALMLQWFMKRDFHRPAQNEPDRDQRAV
jgi:hypothetical protein